MDRILYKSEREIDALNPQDISHLLLSFGRLGLQMGQIATKLSDVAGQSLAQFKTQEIVSMLWGYAKLGIHPGNYLINSVTNEVQCRHRQFKTAELCILLWSTTVIHCWNKTSLAFLAIELSRPERRNSMQTQCFANTTWAFGKILSLKLEEYELPLWYLENFMIEILSSAHNRLLKSKPIELGQVLYAAALLSYVDTPLYNGFANCFISRPSTFKNWELVLFVWAFGKVKYSHDRLFYEVTYESKKESKILSIFHLSPWDLRIL